MFCTFNNFNYFLKTGSTEVIPGNVFLPPEKFTSGKMYSHKKTEIKIHFTCVTQKKLNLAPLKQLSVCPFVRLYVKITFWPEGPICCS